MTKKAKTKKDMPNWPKTTEPTGKWLCKAKIGHK